MNLEVEVADTLPERAHALAQRLGLETTQTTAPLDEVDLLVEAAAQTAVAGPVITALRQGVDCMVLSTGAFLQADLLEQARQAMEETGAKCHLPSGGIAGLDAVKTLALDEDATVTLTTRKPPTSLGLAADKEGELFSGPATEAVAKFPKNVNVAATLTLAGLAPHVRVLSDPSLERNTHEVHVKSRHVDVRVQVESEPSPTNPATSYVAVLSAQALLERLVSDFQVGT